MLVRENFGLSYRRHFPHWVDRCADHTLVLVMVYGAQNRQTTGSAAMPSALEFGHLQTGAERQTTTSEIRQ